MNSEPPTCEGCIFYHIDGDDIGTCRVTENIVEPYQQNRVYSSEGKAPALMEGSGGRTINVIPPPATCTRIRRLTPAECARLQTIPEWYKWVVSETQQYRMLGNGWTVEVIAHILQFLPESMK